MTLEPLGTGLKPTTHGMPSAVCTNFMEMANLVAWQPGYTP